MGTKTLKPAQKNNRISKKVPLYRRKTLLWPASVVVGLVVATWLAFMLSPWPGALLIRTVFNHGDRQTLAALQKHTPSTPVTVLSDQRYKAGNRRALLDVYMPESVAHDNKILPVVIWTHGGAWVSGDKTNDAPYFKLVAAQGFVVVSLNYSLAPGKTYPTQIHELNEAHAYIVAHATRFHVDSNKIFLAGDSAGANLSSQMAALITNPAYAEEVGVQPSLKPSQLAGTILFCGIYKMEGLVEADPNLPKIISWGDDQTVWAYSGSRATSGPLMQQMSPHYYATKDFPPTFISGGNGDPLTTKQSIPLADKLTDAGVPVTTLFYPAGHTPSLPHEYQFNLDNTDGQQAFNRMLAFLNKYSSN